MSARARRFFGCVLPVALVVFGCGSLVLMSYAGQVVVQLVPVADRSMSPVLEPGWTVLVNNAAFWAREPEYGSVISVGAPEGKAFRRIYAMPGQTVEIRGGLVFVDDEESRVLDRGHGSMPPFGPVTLGADEYFVLAEDRSHDDSRAWGPLKRDQLYGLALFYFPRGSRSMYPVDPTPTPSPRATP